MNHLRADSRKPENVGGFNVIKSSDGGTQCMPGYILPYRGKKVASVVDLTS